MYTANYEKVLGEKLLKLNGINGEVLSANWHMNGSCTVVWRYIEKIFIFKRKRINTKIFTPSEVEEAYNALIRR